MQFPNINTAAVSPCDPKPEHTGGKEEHGGEEAECELGFELLAGCLAGDATPVPDVAAVQGGDVLILLACRQYAGCGRMHISY
jgi:hypothetical protein